MNLPLSKPPSQLPKIHTGPIYTTKFNNSGEYLMTGSQDRSVCLYNPEKNLMIKHYKNLHNYDVSGLDIAEDNSKFVTGGSDKNVILTDVIEGKCIKKYSGHNGRITSLVFNSQRNLIVSASYDTTVRCWDNKSNSYTPIDIIKGFKDSVTHVQVRGYEIICGSMDATVRFYDVRNGQFICDEIGDAVQSMAVANSGRAYLASGLQGGMYLVERSSGNKVMEYRGHQINNHSINCKFNLQDSYVYSGSADGGFYIYDIMKSDPVKVLKVSDKVLSAIDVSEGKVIAGDHDGKLYYWKK